MSHHILDAGCGRGGSSFTMAERFGCKVDGVTISSSQHEYAVTLAKKKGLDTRVNFRVRNYLELDYPDNTFDHIFTNETTQHVWDLKPLFEGFASVLKPGGRYTIVTWCRAHKHEGHNPYHEPINKNYDSTMHTEVAYLDALRHAGLDLWRHSDMTFEATPYWEFREYWEHESGVEPYFKKGHMERKNLYLFISGRKPDGT